MPARLLAGCMDPGSIRTCSLGMSPWLLLYHSKAFVQYWDAADSNPYTVVVAAAVGTVSIADLNYPQLSSDWLSRLQQSFEQPLLLPTQMVFCLIREYAPIQLCLLFQQERLVVACFFHLLIQTHHEDSCVASSFSPFCLFSCVCHFR